MHRAKRVKRNRGSDYMARQISGAIHGHNKSIADSYMRIDWSGTTAETSDNEGAGDEIKWAVCMQRY